MKDHSRVILTVDKGVAIVIMDKVRLPRKSKGTIGRSGNLQSLKVRFYKQNEVQLDQPAQGYKIRRGH